MNTKNLPLKIGLLVLLVAVCGWSLATKWLKLGIDLRGGHSLTFRYERRPEDPADLGEQIISTLKKRIDPMNLRSLEWRPVGDNRIEIRMPAGSEESRQAKNEYREALRRLENHNIQLSQIRRITRFSGDQRRVEISAVVERVEGGEELTQQLIKLGEMYDGLSSARSKLNSVQQMLRDVASGTAQYQDLKNAEKTARANFLEARDAYENFRDQLLDRNVNIRVLEGLFRRYISAREAQQLRKENPKELRRRQEEFQERLKQLRQAYQDHPERLDEINRVVELYREWAEVRQDLDDPADLKRLIAKAGVLEFRIAPASPTSGRESPLTMEQVNEYIEDLQENGPEVTGEMIARGERFVWFPTRGKEASFSGLVTASDKAGQTYILLYNTGNNVMLKGEWSLKDASVVSDETGAPAVGFEFDPRGGKKFAALTSAHVGQPMAIVVDNEVYSAPNIREMITNRGTISGSFTAAEARELAQILKSGSLPARVDPDPVSESSFGPSLGEENRRMGLRAAYIGLIAVAVFMLGYYLLAGAIADVALMLNIILILGAMSLINAVFTLPGIAGVILTIGIAVDANVLIFERLREEQNRGLSVRMALKNAYERAFSAIFDANLTTMITCLILGWVGSEEVRGFAITLGLGIVFSMFTALVVTRWVFQLLLDWKIITKPIKMLRIVGVPKINWMGMRKGFWVVSVVLIVAGVFSLAGQGKDLLGIEFSAGTQALIKLDRDAMLTNPDTGEMELPNDGLVRRKFKTTAEQMEGDLGGAIGKLAGARVERRIDPFRVQNFLKDFDRDDDGQVTAEEWAAAGQNPEYFRKLVASIDDDNNGTLDGGELNDLPSTEYQVFTTETKVSRVRKVMGAAYGKALDIRPRVTFEMVSGSDDDAGARKIRDRLGVSLAADGVTQISDFVIESASEKGFDEMIDFQNGLLMVVHNLRPGLTKEDLLQRIRDMRLQPDYSNLQFSKVEAIPFNPDPNEPGSFTAFAILDRPVDPESIASAEAFNAYAQAAGSSISDALAREESLPVMNFDAAIAAQASQKALIAIILSWLAIVLYLWLRFGSARWGLAAVICLVHDVLIVLGLVAASAYVYNAFGEVLGIQAFKVDLAMVAALLTVIGYSVNDTIVVFDRIRENRGKLTTISPQVLNASINQTLARTLLTSTTTLIVVLVMYIFGGAGIRPFSFALLMGVLFGTYSSIAIASPLLMGFKKALVAKMQPQPHTTEE
ncbi:MAG: protein translocase subunit SecD [Phycisphaerae bacterium]